MMLYSHCIWSCDTRLWPHYWRWFTWPLHQGVNCQPWPKRYSSLLQSMSISYRHNLELSKYSIPYKTYNLFICLFRLGFLFSWMVIIHYYHYYIFWVCPHHSLSTEAGMRSSRSILFFPCPSPGISHFSKEPQFLLELPFLSRQFPLNTQYPVPGQLPSPGRDTSPAWRHLTAFRDEVFKKGDSKGWCGSALLLKELIFQEMLQIWSFIWNLLLNADNSFKISKNNR